MPRDEMRHVVLPCLKTLNALGYLVISDKGRRRFGFVEALAIMEQQPRTPGVVWRQNVGVARYRGQYEHHAGKFAHLDIEERFVKFGVTGLSDINGIMSGGRVLAIECKEPGCEPTPEQAAYLKIVRTLGGVGICVHSVDELLEKQVLLTGVNRS